MSGESSEGVEAGPSRDVSHNIQKSLNELAEQSGECCIYRVPKILRGVNPEAYTPISLPIGPLHKNDPSHSSSASPDFFTNGLYKLKYLRSFLKDSGFPLGLKLYLDVVQKSKERIRGCYAASDPIFSDKDGEFTELVLLDSVFIIQLFREYYNSTVIVGRRPTPPNTEESSSGKDSILKTPLQMNGIASDIMLAENQLPLFILQELYDKAFPPSPGTPSFLQIACTFLQAHSLFDFNNLGGGVLRRLRIRSHVDAASAETSLLMTIRGGSKPLHLLDILRISLQPGDTATVRGDGDMERNERTCPTASMLFEAGVKFQVQRKTYRLLDISI